MKKLQPQELMIGNFIYLDGEVLEVLEINSLSHFEEKAGNIMVKQIVSGKHIGYKSPWIERANPIELTEGWLIDFGFTEFDRTHEDFDWGYEKDDFVLSRMDFASTELSGFYFKGVNEIKIEWVHQLQNLYFAIKLNHLTT